MNQSTNQKETDSVLASQKHKSKPNQTYSIAPLTFLILLDCKNLQQIISESLSTQIKSKQINQNQDQNQDQNKNQNQNQNQNQINHHDIRRP
jgi:hypothetical protein